MLAMSACPGRSPSPTEVEAGLSEVTAAKLEKFESDEAFDRYLEAVDALQPGGWGWPFGCAASDGATAEANAGQAPDESITNNQEQGVDEGGIVKAAGDYFIVLRRGRLFSVRHTDAGKAVLQAVSHVDAQPPGFTQGTWYDEILVSGDRVVLVGYSYRVHATELGLFRLGADGQLSHEATYFLSSNDYYSSRNYASRLVGNKLVFYMPYHLPVGYARGHEAKLPSLRQWKQGNELTPWSEMLRKVETYRPVQRALYPTLHTIVTCELGESMDCSARGLVGPYGRSFYVAPEAVYLWLGGEYPRAGTTDERRRAQNQAVLYRLPLDGGDVTATRVRGMPIDQFSFSLAADGTLRVLASQKAGGDAMWNPEVAAGELTLVKIAADELGVEPSELPAHRYARLPSPMTYGLQNRFIRDHLVYGTGTGWDRSESPHQLYVTPVDRPDQTTALMLSHDVERIEVLGDGAAVVGTSGANLVLSAIQLGEAPSVKATLTRPNAAQGETRSHGFFFKPDGQGGGVLGLPIRHDGPSYRHLRYGSAEVVFVKVAPDLSLSPFGALAASETHVDDRCVVSCTDWYGNARPIFFRGRTYALLGYELVEGVASEEGLRERQRLDFLSATLGN